MDQCIVKQVIPIFANNRKNIRTTSLILAFLVIRNNSILTKSCTKRRGVVYL